MALAIDYSATTTNLTSTGVISFTGVTTTSANELIVITIAGDASATSNVGFTAAGGLTWTRSTSNITAHGSVYVFTAVAATTLSSVTFSLKDTGDTGTSWGGSIQSFTGADTTTRIGATKTGTVSVSGVLSNTLTTTRANSWVYAVADDYNASQAHTLGSAQTSVINGLDAGDGNTYMVWRQTATTTTSGTVVTMNTTTASFYVYELFEILPSTGSVLTKTQPAVSRIAVTSTKTQPSTARIAVTKTKTQPATATIAITNAAPTVALNTPINAATVGSTTPQLAFTGTDAEANPITYETQIDTVNTFNSTVIPGVTIKDSYTDAPNTFYILFGDGGSNSRRGQLFTTTAAYTLGKIQLYHTKTGTPTDGIVVSLYSSVGGTLLATSQTVPSSSLIDSAYNDYIFPSPATLTSATQYFFTISRTGVRDSANYWTVGSKSPGAYSGGDEYSYNSTTTTWSAITGDDAVFKTYDATTGALVDKLSASDTGFTDITNGAHTDPFTSGEQIGYTTPALSAGSTYYWRVRGKDPAGSNTFGAWSSTNSFTISSGTVLTKTQPGTARIAVTKSLTQPGTARVAANITKTQPATARVSNTRTKTQPGTARISNTRTLTQSGIARVARNITKVQPATARITAQVTKTQPAVSRISKTFTKTQPAISRVSNTRTLTQPATARISSNTLSTVTQPATARIARNLALTQSAVARIAKGFTSAQPAISRISITFTRTQAATGRIAVNRTLTQPSTARVARALTKTQPATSRIAIKFSKTQPATARIGFSFSKTQPATARIAITKTKTQPATAKIATTVSKTQPGTARIASIRTKNQPAVSRISVQLLKTQPAIARIAANRTKTQPAMAGLAVQRTFTQPATARIGGNGIQVWNGTAWVSKQVYVYNGSAWVQKPIYRWNGTAWV